MTGLLTRSASEAVLALGPTATGMGAAGSWCRRTLEINEDARSSAASSLGKSAVTATVIATVATRSRLDVAEVHWPLAHPLTWLRLLFQRQAAEPHFQSRLEDRLPLPPHRLGPAKAPLANSAGRRSAPPEGAPCLV